MPFEVQEGRGRVLGLDPGCSASQHSSEQGLVVAFAEVVLSGVRGTVKGLGGARGCFGREVFRLGFVLGLRSCLGTEMQRVEVETVFRVMFLGREMRW